MRLKSARAVVVALILVVPVALAATSPLPVERVPAPGDPGVDAGLVRVIASFHSHDDVDAFLADVDPFVAYRVKHAPALVIDVPESTIPVLDAHPATARVDRDARLPLLLPTSAEATRANAVWGAALGGPVTHPVTGDVIDGSGIGVAVIDSGIDATHPDLVDRVARNVVILSGDHAQTAHWAFEILRPATVNVTNAVIQIAEDFGDAGNTTGADIPRVPSDTGEDALADPPVGWPVVIVEGDNVDEEGHGTHVAGTIAGTGAFSDGKVRGMAPGATLYGIDATYGPTLLISSTIAAWDWVLEHHDKVDPPIDVVNNSYTCGGSDYDPDFLLNRLINEAIDRGITVVFASGNTGGDGTTDNTGGCSNNPRVIGVANYNDHGAGTRDGTMSTSSARGFTNDPATWPDVSAPGTSIIAARATADAVGAVGPVLGAVFDVTPDPWDTGLFQEEGNVFGNAVNQFEASVTFRLGGEASGPGQVNWIVFTQPALMYHAHADAFALGAAGATYPPGFDDPAAFADARYFADVPAGAGPVTPVADAEAHVQPGDRILLEKSAGTAGAPSVRVTAPTGAVVDVVLSFPCEAGCSAAIDLHEHFPGAPADGTWTVSPGRTVFPENVNAPASDEDGEGTLELEYASKSGTSMAAPHVAGIAALLLHANPDLTPVDVMDVIQTTAYKFTWGGAYEPLPGRGHVTSSFDKGAGLVDAHAAVLEAIARR